MPVTIRTPVQAGAASTATSSTRAPGVPAGTIAGDFLILSACWSGGAVTITNPTGWAVSIPLQQQTNENLIVYTRTADGTATDTPTLTISAAATFIATCTSINNWTGTPVFASVLSGAASTTVIYPAINPATSGDLLIYISGIRPATASTQVTAVAPAGGTGGAVTKQIDGCTNVTGSAEVEQAVFTQQLSAATAVTQQNTTVSTSSSASVGAICISAAAAPTGLIPQQLKQRVAYQVLGSRPANKKLASYRG